MARFSPSLGLASRMLIARSTARRATPTALPGMRTAYLSTVRWAAPRRFNLGGAALHQRAHDASSSVVLPGQGQRDNDSSRPQSSSVAHGEPASGPKSEAPADERMPPQLTDEILEDFLLNRWHARNYHKPSRLLYKLMNQLKNADLWDRELNFDTLPGEKAILLRAVHRVAARLQLAPMKKPSLGALKRKYKDDRQAGFAHIRRWALTSLATMSEGEYFRNAFGHVRKDAPVAVAKKAETLSRALIRRRAETFDESVHDRQGGEKR